MDHCKLTRADMKTMAGLGYTVQGLLKEGSYGLVYCGEYAKPSQQPFPKNVPTRLALKVVGTEEQPIDSVNTYLSREMTIHSRISHPYIVPLHSILQVGTKVILATRLVERGSLLDHLLKFGEVREKRARRWFRQLCSAVSFLHGIKVAHRDIKCENILLTGNDNVKLCDFGFSRRCADSKGVRVFSRTHCGSLAYAAPELLMGLIYDPRNADMWALGVVLYAMLNGCLPFPTDKLHSLLSLQLMGHFRFRTKVQMRISTEAYNLVCCLLQPNWLKRFSVEEVLGSDWLAGEKGLAMEEAALENLENFNTKNPIKVEKLVTQEPVKEEEAQPENIGKDNSKEDEEDFEHKHQI